MLSLQIEIFLLMFIGYFLAKQGYFSKETRTQLTNIILLLVLPCSIIRSFEIDLNQNLITSTGFILVISFGIQLLYTLFNKVLYNYLDKDKKVCCQYSTMVSNAGFMGMPIAEEVFGVTGLLYASIFLIPQRIFMWSSGLSLFAKSEKNKVLKQVLTHPCIIAIYIGIVVMILRNFHLYIPQPIEKTLQAISQCNTAMSMLVIGGILSDIQIKDVIDKDAFLYSFYRLIMIPFIIYFLLQFLPVNKISIQLCVLLSAMPAASTTAMLAQKYNGNALFASKLIFVSTLLSLLTLPVCITLLNRI